MSDPETYDDGRVRVVMLFCPAQVCLSCCTLKCKITISEIENGWLSGSRGGRPAFEGGNTPSGRDRRPSEAGSSGEMPPPPPEEQKHSLARTHIERSQSRTTPPQESTEQDDTAEHVASADTDSAFDDDASLTSGSSGSSEESRRLQCKVGQLLLF